MDPKDQVAIHEAMEQQTISITKAGIQANLNARTSILAAANPRHGRYDRTKTLKANVDMTAPIMSRFDLFFIVVDDCDHLIDRSVATHIVDAHRGLKAALDAPFTQRELQIYVKHAKRIRPKISDDAKHRLVKCYQNLRQNDAVGRSKTAYRITVRQLESLIRLAEAHARLHLCDTVGPDDVDEAARLLRKSIISVETDPVVLDDLDDDDDDDLAPLYTASQIPHPSQRAREDDNAAVPEESSPKRARRTSQEEDELPETQALLETLPETLPETVPVDEEEDDDDFEAAMAGSKKRKKKHKKKKRKDDKPTKKLSYEDFQRYSHELTTHLMRKCKAMNIPGLTRTQLIEWYIETHKDVIGDDDDIIKEHVKLLKQILKRLQKDETLIVVPTDDPDPILAVHPNFCPANTAVMY